MFVLWGGGRNGKSTLLATVRDMLGPYAGQLTAETLMMSNDSSTNDIAGLRGVRFATAVETEDGRRLSEARVKQLTGGTDAIKARELYQNFFTFAPQFKLFLATNHKPTIRGTDDAIWDRIRLIPFTVRIGDEERDPELPDKLRAEFAGILAWAVQGCLLWQSGGLEAPEDVTSATKSYRAEMDLIGGFINECCVVGGTDAMGKSDEVAATPLFEAYETWHGDKGITQTKFGRSLTERGFTSKRGTGGRKVWTGIRLKTDEDLVNSE
jgi:putative DNA primase/helicase